MKIIALDSSGTTATVAIAEPGRLLAEYTADNGMTHSQTLLPMLDAITKLSGTRMDEIEGVAVAGGPGSFTGLRIGSATAKGIALTLKKPVISVPTLEALAYNVYGSPGLICPMMNARREQAYTALYRFAEKNEDGLIRFELEILRDQTAADVREWCKEISAYGEKILFLGDGADDFRKILTDAVTVPFCFAPFHQNRPRAAALARRAFEYLEEGKAQPGKEHRPVYLRQSQAEREREARNNQ